MDITLHHEPGYGWKASAKGSINGRSISYNGEYQPTPDEALDRAKKALTAYGMLDLAA